MRSCIRPSFLLVAENAIALREVGGIEAIIDAINRYLDVFCVVDYGCFALCNLADDCTESCSFLFRTASTFSASSISRGYSSMRRSSACAQRFEVL